MQPLPPL